jgi:hypothetical protein
MLPLCYCDFIHDAVVIRFFQRLSRKVGHHHNSQVIKTIMMEFTGSIALAIVQAQYTLMGM